MGWWMGWRRPKVQKMYVEVTDTTTVRELDVVPRVNVFGSDGLLVEGDLLADPARLDIAWVGIDGEADIDQLCDKYWGGMLPSGHGVFPRTISFHPVSDDDGTVLQPAKHPKQHPMQTKERRRAQLRRQEARGVGNGVSDHVYPFEAYVGSEIRRMGNFVLCIHDPNQVTPAEYLARIEREERRNTEVDRDGPVGGRFLHTGIHVRVQAAQDVGVDLVTTIPPSLLSSSTFSAHDMPMLHNPYIHAIHLIQPSDEGLGELAKAGLWQHPKVNIAVLGRDITWDVVWKYARRECQSQRILAAPHLALFSDDIATLQELSLHDLHHTIYTLPHENQPLGYVFSPNYLQDTLNGTFDKLNDAFSKITLDASFYPSHPPYTIIERLRAADLSVLAQAIAAMYTQ
ncbi:hypothetical protein BZG36_03872 [Bifiguratus adelaidae]|uniref:Uncharacterized protein n=1 Tax=Bifiguratus adelaidae TaxID=1938954 RepID=A0A261XXN4_9FUNG|nr:hypothetical protein BZG36_03872 [Bifiguratus adelaidae]